MATVLRDGRLGTVPLREVVPGDVIALAAGSLIPADAVLLEATDCFVNQSVLTGESFPVEKKAGAVAPAAVLSKRANCAFAGLLGFTALPGTLLLTLVGITTLYIGTAELAKARLYRVVA